MAFAAAVEAMDYCGWHGLICKLKLLVLVFVEVLKLTVYTQYKVSKKY